jgi:hypothetical protein
MPVCLLFLLACCVCWWCVHAHPSVPLWCVLGFPLGRQLLQPPLTPSMVCAVGLGWPTTCQSAGLSTGKPTGLQTGSFPPLSCCCVTARVPKTGSAACVHSELGSVAGCVSVCPCAVERRPASRRQQQRPGRDRQEKGFATNLCQGSFVSAQAPACMRICSCVYGTMQSVSVECVLCVQKVPN